MKVSRTAGHIADLMNEKPLRHLVLSSIALLPPSRPITGAWPSGREVKGESHPSHLVDYLEASFFTIMSMSPFALSSPQSPMSAASDPAGNIQLISGEGRARTLSSSSSFPRFSFLRAVRIATRTVLADQCGALCLPWPPRRCKNSQLHRKLPSIVPRHLMGMTSEKQLA